MTIIWQAVKARSRTVAPIIAPILRPIEKAATGNGEKARLSQCGDIATGLWEFNLGSSMCQWHEFIFRLCS